MPAGGFLVVDQCGDELSEDVVHAQPHASLRGQIERNIRAVFVIESLRFDMASVEEDAVFFNLKSICCRAWLALMLSEPASDGNATGPVGE